jgi:hypothetical protein
MKLLEIAVEMKKYALAHPYRPGDDLSAWRRELPRGLSVSFITDGTRHKLALTRQGVAPSAFEEKICLSAFGQELSQTTSRQEKNGGEFHHIILSWGDDPQPAPAAPEPSPAPAQAEPFIAGQYYTACGVVYRAFRQRNNWLLMDVNKSWKAGPVWVVNGLFLRGGRLFAGEYVLSGAKSVWQIRPKLSALSIDDLQLCGIIKTTIDFRELV